MNALNLSHQGLAGMARQLPRVRGTGRMGARLTRRLLSKLSDPILRTKMRDGTTMMLDIRSRMEVEPFWSGDYEVPVLDLIKSLVLPDGVMLDVGANIGFVTIGVANAMREAGGKGQLFSFEPVTSNFARLSLNVEINHLHDLVQLFNIGLGSEQTTLQISMENDNGASTGNAVLSDALLSSDLPGQRTSIRIDRLDNIAPLLSLNQLNFIKVDVEGAEVMFLRGAIETITKHRPMIFGEFNSCFIERLGHSVVEADELLRPLSYQTYKVQNNYITPVETIKTGDMELLFVPDEVSSEMGAVLKRFVKTSV